MKIALWILQGVLAVLFVLHGWLYLFPPASMADMPNQMGLPPSFLRFIGIAEWLAAAGLILPGLTGIKPWLTPLAAAGLMIVMASAIVYHLSRSEPIIPQTVLFILVAFVAYMRWKVVPLQRAVPKRTDR